MPSDEGFNIWGVISGAIGVLALLRLAWICSQFPSRKFYAVETYLHQTEDRFLRDYKQGLHSDEVVLTQFSLEFWQLHRQMDDLKMKVDALDTWFAQFGGWRSGLSDTIYAVRRDIKALLAELIEHSSRERKRLASEGYPQGLGRYLSVQNQERRKSIMTFAIPNNQPGLPRPIFTNDGESSPPRVHSPIPFPPTAQNVISRAGASDPHPSTIPVSVDSDADPDMSLQTQSSSGPQTFPAPNMRRDQRAARREVLCQYARQSYGSSSASLPPRAGLAPSRTKRRRMRFKHFLEEVSDIMKEAAAAMDDDDDDYDDDDGDDYDSDDSADDYDHPV